MKVPRPARGDVHVAACFLFPMVGFNPDHVLSLAVYVAEVVTHTGGVVHTLRMLVLHANKKEMPWGFPQRAHPLGACGCCLSTELWTSSRPGL